jgi:hypothetical protein
MAELQPYEFALFRALKKSAIVLLLMIRLDRPVGESEIVRLLEIDHKTARQALDSLDGLGLLERKAHFNGYQLTNYGKQMALPLTTGQSLIVENIPNESPTTTAINIVDIELNQQAVEERTLGRKSLMKRNPQNTPPEPEFIPRNPLFQENLDEMKRQGIQPNKTTREIADMDHVNPRYIKHMAEYNRKEHKSIPLLITRLKQGDPEPDEVIIPGSESDRLRFASSALFEISS